LTLLGTAAGAEAPGDHADSAVDWDTDGAAQVLSRYPSGHTPVEAQVLRALSTLEVRGTRRDVSLLRHIAANEQPILAAAARRAIAAVRARQRDAQRVAFAGELPGPVDLDAEARAWRAKGLGPAEASCAAYAHAIVGDPAPSGRTPVDGDPERLLADGQAVAAVAALDPAADPSLAARAYEEAGQVRRALRIYAENAVAGDDAAVAALEDYGVDIERLFLGLLRTGQIDDAQALETLVRRGDGWTVRVLAERVKAPAASEQATAADALGRMLIVDLRTQPLRRRAQELARKTLREAAAEGAAPVRPIAAEALRIADQP
jgi:hypothetical protein